MSDFYAHEPAGKRKMVIIKDVLEKEAELKNRRALNILDVGCGNGHLSAYMASLGHNVTAIDIDEGAISAAKEKYGFIPGAVFLKSGIKDVAGSFDAITAFEALEHASDLETFLKSLEERLGSSGLLLVSVPNGWSMEEMVRRFTGRFKAGQALKRWVRGRGVLPKSDSQSRADSPHLRFLRFGAWKKILSAQGFEFVNSWNVSLFFKQLYYLGLRRFIRPDSRFFSALQAVDEKLAHLAPSWATDGWVMIFRKKV